MAKVEKVIIAVTDSTKLTGKNRKVVKLGCFVNSEIPWHTQIHPHQE
jgi:hypothetical protein